MDDALHPLDRATRLLPRNDRGLDAAADVAYGNLNGPHGGATAGTLLRAVLEQGEAFGDPVALTVNLCAPIRIGPMVVKPLLRRAGKNTQHWSIETEQEGVVCATASVVMGHRPPGWTHRAARGTEVTRWHDTPVLDTRRAKLPWLDRFEFRFVEGAVDPMPHQPNETRSGRSVVWLNHNPQRSLDFVGLAALSDVFFMRIFHVRGHAGPMGSVTLTTYFHASREVLAAVGDNPLLGEADAAVFHRGFHDQTCRLWAADGALLASGTQMVWFKDQ
jgi:acyl-CoA thioesterase